MSNKNTHNKQNKSVTKNNDEKNAKSSILKKGDLYYANLSPVIGSEQGGVRPVLIIQNNTGNKHSPTTIVAAITSVQSKAQLPTHVMINENVGLPKESVILLEQIRTIDKSRLREKIGQISKKLKKEVDKALRISLHLENNNED